MKTTSFSAKRSAGIGLIEVLVATVVVAVGLMAVASLQGDLISGSRSNKTRAEARALADTKIEQLRDTIQRAGAAGYDSLASSAANESIAGVNETFSRGWTVTDLANPEGKQISVTVSWAGDQVVVQSIIAFDSVGNSALLAKGEGTAGTPINGPSTNAESSDEITKTIAVPSSTPGSVVTVGGKFYIVQDTRTKAIGASYCAGLGLTEFENGLLTRRIDHDGVSGDEAIELYEKVTITVSGTAVDYCIPRVRYNGGVIIPIRGSVYSRATAGSALLSVDLFTFNATESGAYCVFKPGEGANSAPYTCYVGGNCQGFPGTASTDVTHCPGSISAAKVGPGGWRGKVGLLGVASSSPSGGKNVCFAEEIAGTPATLDTARNYYTLRGGLNEGINKPYSCHNFIIIDGQNTEAQVHAKCVSEASTIAGLTLASKNIQRTISSGNNIFDPVVDEAYCTPISYTITGTITNANSAPAVTTLPSGSCSATTTSYTCTVTTTATSATVSGVFNGETRTCTVSSLSTSGNICNLPAFTATANPAYVINGTISGTAAAANAVVLSLSNGGSCINNNNGTYTCTITTALGSVTLTPTIVTGATVSLSAAEAIITLPGASATLTGPSISASGVYTISGTISIGNNVSVTTVTAAVDTGAGTCTLTGTHAASTSDTYSCTVPAGANHLTFAISPACSTGGGSKKYELTDGTTTTLGTGNLVINYSNITGNISKNITLTKSNTNC